MQNAVKSEDQYYSYVTHSYVTLSNKFHHVLLPWIPLTLWSLYLYLFHPGILWSETLRVDKSSEESVDCSQVLIQRLNSLSFIPKSPPSFLPPSMHEYAISGLTWSYFSCCCPHSTTWCVPFLCLFELTSFFKAYFKLNLLNAFSFFFFSVCGIWHFS